MDAVSKTAPAHDDLQPLSKTQIAQVEDYLASLKENNQSMWDIPEGTERTWEMEITPELVILYADGVEDFNPWYEAWPVGPGESPFGTAVAPPLLAPRHQSWFHREGMGRSEVGGVAAGWRTEFIAPVMVGTTVRFHGRLTKRYVKRGRQYTEREFTIEDAATGKLLVRHTAIALAKYARVEDEGRGGSECESNVSGE
jgi:acyl dehydratase